MKKSKLKKRLRKKFHVGEFQEFGFEINVKFNPNLSETSLDNFYHAFIEEVERNKLLFGGGGSSETLQGFITASKKYQSPTAPREKIGKWLETQLEIAEFEVGNLKDAGS